jgi:hypothetical protein
MIGEPITIYVELVDEGVDCWRPVKAERIATDTFRIVESIPSASVGGFNLATSFAAKSASSAMAKGWLLTNG